MMRLIATVTVMAVSLMMSATALAYDTAEEAFREYIPSINTDDFQHASRFYSREGPFYWIENGVMQFESAEEATAGLRGLSVAGGQPNLTIRSLRVAPMGKKSALLTAHIDFVMRDRSGTVQFALDRWMTMGMTRGDQGWRIMAMHSSSYAPSEPSE